MCEFIQKNNMYENGKQKYKISPVVGCFYVLFRFWIFFSVNWRRRRLERLLLWILNGFKPNKCWWNRSVGVMDVNNSKCIYQRVKNSSETKCERRTIAVEFVSWKFREKNYFCMIFWDWHRRVVNVHVQSESTKAKLIWNFQVFALLNLRFTFCVCKYHSRSLSRVKKMQKSKLTIEPTENRERDWGMTRSLKNVVKKANGEVREESFRRRHIASTSFSWWRSSNLIGWMEEVHQLNSTSTPARTTFSTIQECRSLTLILLLVRCKLHKFLDLTRALNINLILDFHSSFVLHFRCLLPSSSTASLLICLHEFCCKIYSRFRIFVFKKPLTPRRTRLDVVSRSHVLSRRTQASEATKAKHNTTHSAQAKAQQRPEMTRRDEEISKRKPEKKRFKDALQESRKKMKLLRKEEEVPNWNWNQFPTRCLFVRCCPMLS